ncbi:hypothetical protein B0H12DRAFT_1070982 [Mycena haematopus]|nr:hypothetical protein B0H12DRAFT_1072725 [Mycena haematopus]KAJ7255528.1 hypothetical protein B0H12DRAFT_1070982 [Mycena haematopus]
MRAQNLQRHNSSGSIQCCGGTSGGGGRGEIVVDRENGVVAEVATQTEIHWQRSLSLCRYLEKSCASVAHQDAQDDLAQLDVRINDLLRSLSDVETEHDYFNPQVTYFSRDLEAAQREIAEAETWYSALQLHQLNSMSSNEATRALRAQFADQETRVLRRTELRVVRINQEARDEYETEGGTAERHDDGVGGDGRAEGRDGLC